MATENTCIGIDVGSDDQVAVMVCQKQPDGTILVKECATADKVTKLRELLSPETFAAINKHLELKANVNPSK